MRLYEFDARDPNNQKPALSLGHINTLKKVNQKRRDDFTQRKALMNLMYGDHDGELDTKSHDLDMRERELASRERILKGEIQVVIDRAEVDQKSREHIQKMADDYLSKK